MPVGGRLERDRVDDVEDDRHEPEERKDADHGGRDRGQPSDIGLAPGEFP